LSRGVNLFDADAIFSTSPLIHKACSIPAEDALKKGYDLKFEDGTSDEIIENVNRLDKEIKIKEQLISAEYHRRVFGLSLPKFNILSLDKLYYEKPFNIDGVKKNSYQGIKVVCPYYANASGEGLNTSEPDMIDYQEPTWWLVNGKKIHKSHFYVSRYAPVPDNLKPRYRWAGQSLASMLAIRAFCVETLLDETPNLVKTKRFIIHQMDLASRQQDLREFAARQEEEARTRNSYGTKVIDVGDSFNILDTNLAYVDEPVETQIQFMAATANMPATKLLGTVPKGMNATGEHEIAQYNTSLEFIQEGVYKPILEMHYSIALRSLGYQNVKVPDVVFPPLVTATEAEKADVRLKDAQTDTAYLSTGVLTATEVRERLDEDEDCPYRLEGPAPGDYDVNEEEEEEYAAEVAEIEKGEEGRGEGGEEV
jgi:hypothetical protein